jgi:hypothetical protein
MLFDEQLVSARRSELDRQASRAGAYGSQSDVMEALRSPRRRPAMFRWLGAMCSPVQIRQLARGRSRDRFSTIAADATASPPVNTGERTLAEW